MLDLYLDQLPLDHPDPLVRKLAWRAFLRDVVGEQFVERWLRLNEKAETG